MEQKAAELSTRIEAAQNGDKEAREALIKENIGLVRHIVKRFLGRGYDPEDLFQIGCIGLMKAIDKFDTSYEVCFSTYAVPMIQGEMRRFLRDDGMLKVSRTLKEQAYRIRQAREKLEGVLGREPTLQEIEAETGLNGEEIVMAMEAGCPVESIYRSVYQSDNGSGTGEIYLIDQLASTTGRDDEKAAVLDHLLLNQLLESLDRQERQLIHLRYFDNRTQVEVARLFGISQVQVSRMEKRILLQMRSKCQQCE